MGVNNNKTTDPSDIPIVNCIVYHPFDHIVAFSAIGKRPFVGLPLSICIYKFEKNSQGKQDSANYIDEIPPSSSSVLGAVGVKAPSFFDAKNDYKDKLIPLTYHSLPSSKKSNAENKLENAASEEKKSSRQSEPQSPENIKSMLHKLDQFLIEKSQP